MKPLSLKPYRNATAMKNRTSIILSILTLLTMSCLPDNFAGQGAETEVRVDFSLDSFSLSRSSSASEEDGIRTVQLFVVDGDGDIVDEDFRSGSTALSFKGRVGETYHLYAFANSPSRIEGLETEDDILGWEYRTTLSEHFPCGFPMAGDRKWTVDGKGASVGIELTRLVSKLILTLDKSEMDLHGEFTLNSVKLHNCPSSIKPFVQGHKVLDAADAGEGDLASEADLTKLNAGESVCFYILENMQGDLLPSNSDPWEKIPSNLSPSEGLCTYLEASGSYISPGYTGSDSYRMYLGKDNVGNFDLCRNSLYRLTLSPTEDNMRKDGNWKITASDWKDTRKLSFSPSSLNILPGKSLTTTLSFSPSQFEFSLSEEGFADAMLSYTVSGKKLTITCSSEATKGKTAVLKARSWDGRVEASCNIRVGEGYTTNKTITITPADTTVFLGDSLQMKAMYHVDYLMDGVKYNERDTDVTKLKSTDWTIDLGPECLSVDSDKCRGLVRTKAVGYGSVLCMQGSTMSGTAVYVIARTGSSAGGTGGDRRE
jgi:hypothetical protein